MKRSKASEDGEAAEGDKGAAEEQPGQQPNAAEVTKGKEQQPKVTKGKGKRSQASVAGEATATKRRRVSKAREPMKRSQASGAEEATATSRRRVSIAGEPKKRPACAAPILKRPSSEAMESTGAPSNQRNNDDKNNNKHEAAISKTNKTHTAGMTPRC